MAALAGAALRLRRSSDQSEAALRAAEALPRASALCALVCGPLLCSVWLRGRWLMLE